MTGRRVEARVATTEAAQEMLALSTLNSTEERSACKQIASPRSGPGEDPRVQEVVTGAKIGESEAGRSREREDREILHGRLSLPGLHTAGGKRTGWVVNCARSVLPEALCAFTLAKERVNKPRLFFPLPARATTSPTVVPLCPRFRSAMWIERREVLMSTTVPDKQASSWEFEEFMGRGVAVATLELRSVPWGSPISPCGFWRVDQKLRISFSLGSAKAAVSPRCRWNIVGSPGPRAFRGHCTVRASQPWDERGIGAKPESTGAALALPEGRRLRDKESMVTPRVKSWEVHV